MGLKAQVSPEGKRKKALYVHITKPYGKVEMVVVKALQAAGFDCIPLGWRGEFRRYDELVGTGPAYMFSDFDVAGDPDWVNRQAPRLVSSSEWLGLTYRGVHVGRFALASAMRELCVGELDFQAPEVQAKLVAHLNASVSRVIAAARLLDEIKPDCLLTMDRGYSGAGEIFDLALLRGLDAITWHFGYKSDRLALKRYTLRNERDHPLSPSTETWNQMRSLAWDRSYGDAVRQELFDCYKSEDWFSVVGTQFNKRILSREATQRELGLSPDKKVAVIFPHILWDGSFFYGDDLFRDYTEWLVEAVKAACANDRVQWLVKLHPAHVVKAVREDRDGRPAELAVIEHAIGTLPPHVKLIQPEAPISTFSLFEIADYVLTVRGTVGIEAALFGIPVITAGTGRYDSRGFTIDSTTREEYRARLATLETLPPLTPQQIELAERYAYNVFLCRPLRLSCASLGFGRDPKATMKLTVHCQTPEQWLESPDISSLAKWFIDGRTEDFTGTPVVPDEIVSRPAYAAAAVSH
jgi:hypothetical protein